MEQQRINRRKLLTGTVVSDKMQKTRVVKVVWVAKHPKYLKPVQHMVKYKAHDENNGSKTGDVVKIMETRPISKEKRWIIVDHSSVNQEVKSQKDSTSSKKKSTKETVKQLKEQAK